MSANTIRTTLTALSAPRSMARDIGKYYLHRKLLITSEIITSHIVLAARCVWRSVLERPSDGTPVMHCTAVSKLPSVHELPERISGGLVCGSESLV